MEKLYYLHPTVEHRHRPVNNCEYISFPSWEIPRIIHAHDSTDSPFFFHGIETKGRESFVEYGSRSFLERRFNRSLLSRSSLLSSFAIPNSSFVVNALERRGRKPSITSKRRRRNNFPPWRYVKLWFSSIDLRVEREGGEEKKRHDRYFGN